MQYNLLHFHQFIFRLNNKIMGSTVKERLKEFIRYKNYLKVAFWNSADYPFALGHKASNRVTDIYVRRNKLKVDEANRKVINYFNSNDIIEY